MSYSAPYEDDKSDYVAPPRKEKDIKTIVTVIDITVTIICMATNLAEVVLAIRIKKESL